MVQISGAGQDHKADQSYTRGIALGMRDIQEKRPLNQLYRLALDEFSFGYRAAYYLVLSGAAAIRSEGARMALQVLLRN